LDAVRALLALRDLAEYRANLSQQLVDDPVLGTFLEVLESVLKKITRVRVRMRMRRTEEGRGIAYLHDEPSSLMACKRGPLALEGFDAERRSIRTGVDEKRR
jgi:hypothetical protein